MPEQKIINAVNEIFDLRPYGIVKMLDLLKPVYRPTSAYGHFGRAPEKDSGFSWEQTNLVSQLKSALNMPPGRRPGNDDLPLPLTPPPTSGISASLSRSRPAGRGQFQSGFSDESP